MTFLDVSSLDCVSCFNWKDFNRWLQPMTSGWRENKYTPGQHLTFRLHWNQLLFKFLWWKSCILVPDTSLVLRLLSSFSCLFRCFLVLSFDNRSVGLFVPPHLQILVPSLVHKYICQIHFSLLLQQACSFIRFTSCKEYVWSRRVKCLQLFYILLNVNGTLMLQFKWLSLTWILFSKFFTRDFSTARFWRAFIWGKDIIFLFLVKLVGNSEIKSN